MSGWKRNMVCVATYKVLEGDNFLNQFEDASLSFEDAGETKLGDLRYALRTTSNSAINEALSIELARDFLIFLTKIYDVTRQNETESDGAIIRAIASVLANPENKISDLAAKVDKHLKFPDES